MTTTHDNHQPSTGEGPIGPDDLRASVTRAILESLGLIWPDDAEPMRTEAADAAIDAAARVSMQRLVTAVHALPRHRVAPQAVGIIVQREIRNPAPVEVVRASDLERLLTQLADGGPRRRTSVADHSTAHAVEPGDLLAEVTDTDGHVWTRYRTDPTGRGRHWWSVQHGWRSFADLRLAPVNQDNATTRERTSGSDHLDETTATDALEVVPPGKTGSGGRPWVRLEQKPDGVDDRYLYWTTAPPALSERCQYWLRQIERGWRPNRRWSAYSYDSSAQQYGIYIWEYQNVISPALDAAS